jgi:3D (Asp-Asp-Asp) domain-containing protein
MSHDPISLTQFPHFREGTIAADTNLFRFSTRINIPGYGDGVVEVRCP